jgi:hypothetical protein
MSDEDYGRYMNAAIIWADDATFKKYLQPSRRQMTCDPLTQSDMRAKGDL